MSKTNLLIARSLIRNGMAEQAIIYLRRALGEANKSKQETARKARQSAILRALNVL